MDNSDWISTSEGAQLTGYDKDYVRRLARDGKVTSQKFGFATMISKSSLLAYYRSDFKKGDKR